MFYCLNTDAMPRISYLGYTDTGSGWKHFERTCSDYILYLISDGDMYIAEDGRIFDLHKGDAILLQPYHTHVGTKESKCSYYYIHVKADTFTALDCSESESIEQHLLDNRRNFIRTNPLSYEQYDTTKLLVSKVVSIRDSRTMRAVEKLWNDAIEAFELGNEYYKIICTSKFLEIMTVISNYFTDCVFNVDTEISSFRQGNRITEAVMEYLRAHYSGKITGDMISDALEMNFDYMNRIFKKYLGFTIFEYLKIIRINKAKELLMNRNMKIYEIAEATGFTDEFHFSRVFKSVTGISPKKYAV